MFTALEKAFRSTDPEVQSIRSHSYGRIHTVLAGCYFQTRAPAQFLSHLFRSLRYDPRNLSYFVAYPIRMAARLFAR